jgi:hypothetical protein
MSNIYTPRSGSRISAKFLMGILFAVCAVTLIQIFLFEPYVQFVKAFLLIVPWYIYVIVGIVALFVGNVGFGRD